MKRFHANKRPALLAIALGAALIVPACGGGGVGTDPGLASSSSAPTNSAATATLVTGTVASGKALANAQVTLSDSNGVSRTVSASASGSYTMDVSGLVAPFVLTASGQSGSLSVSLVSVEDAVQAGTSNVINITPWTTAIAAMLSTTGRAKDLSAVKDKASISASLTTVDNYTKTLLAPSLAAAGFSTGAGPIATPFVADGTGYDSIYDNTQFGQTSKGTLFIAARCAPAQISSCTTYSDPADQSSTNPNLCGFDIASGAGIPCDPSMPLTSAPAITLPLLGPADAAGGFAISGPGVHFGPGDTPPPANPVRVSVVPCVAGSSACQIAQASAPLPSGFPANVTLGTYLVSGQVCASSVGCIALPSQTIQNSDTSTFANAVVAAFQSGASAVAGSAGCTQSQSFTPFDGSSFSGTFSSTCTSQGQSASATVTLAMKRV